MMLLFECHKKNQLAPTPTPLIQLVLEVRTFPDGRDPKLQATFIEDGETVQLMSTSHVQLFFSRLAVLVEEQIHRGYAVVAEE